VVTEGGKRWGRCHDQWWGRSILMGGSDSAIIEGREAPREGVKGGGQRVLMGGRGPAVIEGRERPGEDVRAGNG
jgi:hypothetical protein